MNYTSIEQSKTLLELGLEPKTSDMMYVQHQTVPIIKNDCFAIEFDTPCWSTEALLELMPDVIDNHLVGHRLTIDREGKTFNVSYDSIMTKEPVILYAESNLLDAVYQMMVYLLKNNLPQDNYIKIE